MRFSTEDKRRAVLWVCMLLLLAVAAPMVGCQQDEDNGSSEGTTAEQLLITPEFRIDGLDELRDELYLEDLLMGVGSVSLEPLDEEYEGLVYVTRMPMLLHFDLSSGETEVIGEQLTLPHPGNYHVSIKLEPYDGEGETLVGQSMRINGRLARIDGIPDTKETAAAGEPVPLPWQPDGSGDSKTAPVSWVPWTYGTSTTTQFSLNDVHFTGERTQKLVIAFDLSTWLDDAFRPINETVKNAPSVEEDAIGEEMDADFSPVDVTGAIDDAGLNELRVSSEAYVL